MNLRKALKSLWRYITYPFRMGRKGFQEALEDWNYVFRKELKTIFRDPGILIFLIIVPLAYPLVYTYIYNNEVIRDVPVAVVDDCATPLSRTYLRKVDATPDVAIAYRCPDMKTARELIKRREVYGIIYIPQDFQRDLARMQQTKVSIFVDMSGILYYKAMLLANTNVSLAMNADIKVQRAGNTTDEQDKVTTYPIAYEQVDIYNPESGYAAFLIPAVLILILQQTLVLGVGVAAGTAREKNSYHELVLIHRHHHGLLRIVLGKGFAYLLVYLWNIVYVLGVIPHIFNLPQIGNPAYIWMIIIPFILAVIFFSMTISVLIRQREMAFIIVVFFSVPLLFLSGISWPATAIPTFWKYFSYVFPSTFGINAFVKINSMGGEMISVKTEWYALWIQAFCYFILTLFVYRYEIISSRRKRIALYEQKKAALAQRQNNEHHA